MRASMRRWTIGLLCLGGALAFSGCSQADGGASGEAAAQVAPAASKEASAERLLERCAERWGHVSQGNWIEAYEFFAPAERKTSSLQQFLKGKDHHRYEKPEQPQLLKLNGDTGKVLVASMWTPTHPALHKVDLGQDSMTQRLEVVETWRWMEGDWYYLSAESAQEFFLANPGMTRPASDAPSAPPAR